MAAKKPVVKKSEKFPKLFFVCVGFVCVVLLCKQIFFTPVFKHYKEFGIDLPTKYSLHGIDVSHHQGEINWEMVAAMKVKNIQLRYAFIKATEGVSLQDKYFDENYSGAKKQGLLVGAYHFLIPFRGGKEQARNFLNTAKIEKGDLVPVLDIEQNSGVPPKILQQRIKEWLLVVEEAVGAKPIIYTNVDYYENYIKGEFDEYPLWIAHYKVKDKPAINADWYFWQHSETGHVSGINTEVDFNVFSGNLSDLEDLMLP
jgi:lysozyme